MRWLTDERSGSLEFAIRRLGITTVRGRFARFTAAGEGEANGLPRTMEVRVDATSVSTGDDVRDAELQSVAFLDVARHPEIVFVSDGLDWQDDHVCTFHGQLSLHGVTLPLAFLVTVGSVESSATVGRRVALEAAGTVNIARWDVHRPPGVRGRLLALGERVTFTAIVHAAAEPTAAA